MEVASSPTMHDSFIKGDITDYRSCVHNMTRYLALAFVRLRVWGLTRDDFSRFGHEDVDSSVVFNVLACQNFSLTRFTSSLLSCLNVALNFLLSWLCQVW